MIRRPTERHSADRPPADRGQHPADRDVSDLIAVRDLPPGNEEPSAAALARTWAEVVRRQEGARSRRGWRWRVRWAPVRVRRVNSLVPVGATAVAIVVVLGGTVLVAATPLGSGSGWPGPGTWTGDGPAPRASSARATPISVAYRMRPILAAAERIRPVSLTDGEVVRVRVDGLRAVAGGTSPRAVDTTVPTSGQVLAPHRYDLHVDDRLGIRGVTPYHDDAGHGPVVPSGRRPGESPGHPYPPGYVPEVLAGLATDSEQLRPQLLTLFGDSPGWSEEHRLVAGMGDLFAVHDAFLTPQLRTALYRFLASLDRVTVRTVTVGGRELVGLRHMEAATAEELLLDPISGRTAGRQTVAVARDPVAQPAGAFSERWYDVSIISRYLWTDEVVPMPAD